MNNTKDTIITELTSTNRPGMPLLIEHMRVNGFFAAPCSGGNHMCQEGGLAEHSLNVYRTALKLNETLNANIPIESIIICSLLHDLGKMGDYGKANYVPNMLKSGKQSETKPYETNSELLYIDHEIRSVEIAREYIQLTEQENFAILMHNGLYGSFKYEIPGKETPLYLGIS